MYDRIYYPHIWCRFSTISFCRSPACRVICSRIRRAHENAWRRLPNGSEQFTSVVVRGADVWSLNRVQQERQARAWIKSQKEVSDVIAFLEGGPDRMSYLLARREGEKRGEWATFSFGYSIRVVERQELCGCALEGRH